MLKLSVVRGLWLLCQYILHKLGRTYCRVREGTGSQFVVICLSQRQEPTAGFCRVLLKLEGMLPATGCQGYSVLLALLHFGFTLTGIVVR